MLYSNASAISLVKEALESVALQSICTLFELTKQIKVGDNHRQMYFDAQAQLTTECFRLLNCLYQIHPGCITKTLYNFNYFEEIFQNLLILNANEKVITAACEGVAELSLCLETKEKADMPVKPSLIFLRLILEKMVVLACQQDCKYLNFYRLGERMLKDVASKVHTPSTF